MYRHKKSSRQTRGASGPRSSLLAQARVLLDRTGQLSDGTVSSPQDAFEMRVRSNNAPTNIPKQISNQSYWIRLNRPPVQLTTSTTVNVYAGLNICLNHYAGYADLASVFDQYCIVAVVVRFQPTGSTGIGLLPQLYTAIDHDDATTPSSIASVQSHSSCVNTTGLGQTRLIRPRFATAAYNGSFGAYANQSGYLDCGSADVQHYGVKMAVSPSSVVVAFDVVFEAVVHFRDNQ